MIFDPKGLPKFLMVSGIFLIFLGVIWQWGGKFFPLGKLPGDVSIEKENFKFYFPWVSSLVVSFIISFILYLISRFSGGGR